MYLLIMPGAAFRMSRESSSQSEYVRSFVPMRMTTVFGMCFVGNSPPVSRRHSRFPDWSPV